MIELIQILNYRCLRYVNLPLQRFHVLVGANASGKSTFLDAIQFLSHILNNGIDEAIKSRGSTFDELTFAGNGNDIEFAIEAKIPENIKSNPYFNKIRYELRIGKHIETEENCIKEERVILLKKEYVNNGKDNKDRSLFPIEPIVPSTVLIKKYSKGIYRRVVTKNPEGNDNFYIEESGKSGWLPSFKLGIKKSALANLPEDVTKFPAATWLKGFLQNGIRMIILNSLLMRRPSSPGLGTFFRTDGSNLPWVIENLKKNQGKYNQWIEHLKILLPDIDDIVIIEREEDKHKYIKIRYKNGITVPSWLLSDGTLRALALTIIAYIKDIQGVFLIEEPENGIHPAAIECVYQSLSSVYNAQIFLASHSPVLLSLVKPAELLCFSKTNKGITDIIYGSEHPKLKDWQGDPNLSVLFAAGILS
ncbi:MAG: methylation-associated defense system AAA family ATPase MAD3 [Bacteroidales bacterium]